MPSLLDLVPPPHTHSHSFTSGAYVVHRDRDGSATRVRAMWLSGLSLAVPLSISHTPPFPFSIAAPCYRRGHPLQVGYWPAQRWLYLLTAVLAKDKGKQHRGRALTREVQFSGSEFQTGSCAAALG